MNQTETIGDFRPYIGDDKHIILINVQSQIDLNQWVDNIVDDFILIKYEVNKIIHFCSNVYFCFENKNIVKLLEEKFNNKTFDFLILVDFDEIIKYKNKNILLNQSITSKIDETFLLKCLKTPPFISYECICKTKSAKINLINSKEIFCLLSNYMLYLSTLNLLTKDEIKKYFNEINLVVKYPPNKLEIVCERTESDLFCNKMWIGNHKTIVCQIVIFKAFKLFSKFIEKHLLFLQSQDVIRNLKYLEDFNYKYMY